MRLALLTAIVLTTGLLLAGSASASTVCVVGGVATFAAGDVASGACSGQPSTASETNQLTIDANPGGDIVFTDPGSTVSDGDGAGGCTAAGNTGTCPGVSTYRFELGAGDDTAVVHSFAGTGVSTGGPGNDTLTGGALADNFDGGPGMDFMSGGAGDDTLLGGDDTDVINGDAGKDTLSGGAGNDALDGGSDADTLDGGPGADSLHGGDDPDVLAGGPGPDSLFGGTGDDTENGGDDNDSLDGGALGCTESGGNDLLNGDGGDDALCGGTGPSGGPDADALNGGAGEDTAYYVRAAAVNVSLNGVASDGEPGEGDNVQPDVEDVVGGSGDDVLTGSDVRNVLDGGAGADSLSGLGGDDVLKDSGGDSAADRLDGGGGDDSLAGGAGPDTYIGGDGEDAVVDYENRSFPVTITLDGTADDGYAGEGDNVGADVEDVTGGSAADTIIGNDADNELAGGAGDDTIAGGPGNDGISGGAGRDVLDGGSGRDDVNGNGGADTIRTRDGSTDRANCGGGTDSVQGEARDDIAGNCENVDIAPPTAVKILSVTVTRAGFVVVKVTCPAIERSCAGTVLVKTVRRIAKRFIKLGQVGYRLRGGDTKVLKAKIAAKDRRPLKKARRVKIRTFVTNANPDTGVSTSATNLTTVTTRGL